MLSTDMISIYKVAFAFFLVYYYLVDKFCKIEKDYDDMLIGNTKVVLKVVKLKSGGLLIGLNEARRLIPICQNGQRIYFDSVDNEAIIISDASYKRMLEDNKGIYKIDYVEAQYKEEQSFMD